MPHITKLIMLLCSVAALTFAANTFAEDVDSGEDSGKVKQQIYHVFGDVDLLPTTDIQYAKPRIVIKSIFPKIVSETPDEYIDDFNQLVRDLISDEVKDFKTIVADNKDIQSTLLKSQIKNELTIDFDASVANTADIPLISIRFSVSGYSSGMAHPYNKHVTLNYDLDSGEEMELSEVFKPDADYLTILSNYSRDILSRKVKDQQMMLNGTEPKADNFSKWNIKPYGLSITFDEGTVAPRVYGTQTVLIPYSALKEVVSPDSPLENCVKHKRRCAQNNLLTGGFLDEARNTRMIDTSHSILNPRLSKV